MKELKNVIFIASDLQVFRDTYLIDPTVSEMSWVERIESVWNISCVYVLLLHRQTRFGDFLSEERGNWYALTFVILLMVVREVSKL